MSLVKINWHPSPTELRKFGLVQLIGFAILGSLALWGLHKPETAKGCFAFGAIAGGLGLTGLKIALPIYWAWMGVAFVMGNVVSRVALVVFYYGVITPTGLIMRLTGRDALALQRRQTETYWRPFRQPATKDRYQRQF